MLADYSTLEFERSAKFLENRRNPIHSEPLRIRKLKSIASSYIQQSKLSIYMLEYLKIKSPEIKKMISTNFAFIENNVKTKEERLLIYKNELKIDLNERIESQTKEIESHYKNEALRINKQYMTIINKNNMDLENILSDHKKAVPHLAALMSDYLVYDYKNSEEILRIKSRPAFRKAKDIKELRLKTQHIIEEYKVIEYQFKYLLQVFPAIEDFLDIEYENFNKDFDINNYDPIRNFISKEEWLHLSEDGKNQLALDNYMLQRNKSN